MSGKNATRAALITFDCSPRPNQTTISGASATLGIAWNMTMNGYRKYSTRRLSATGIANPNASTMPSTKPSMVSVKVTPICST